MSKEIEKVSNVPALSAETIKKYLVQGNADKVTDQEVMMFAALCEKQGLDPWVRDAYLVKYGDGPASLITAYAAFEKRADLQPEYDGMESGIIVTTPLGEVIEREGAYKLVNETVVGGWASVYRKDRTHAATSKPGFGEYNTGKSSWAKMPATMIEKVAKSQALRKAFPQQFTGLYSQEEMGSDEPLPVTPVSTTIIEPKPAKKPPQEPSTAPQTPDSGDSGVSVRDELLEVLGDAITTYAKWTGVTPRTAGNKVKAECGELRELDVIQLQAAIDWVAAQMVADEAEYEEEEF